MNPWLLIPFYLINAFMLVLVFNAIYFPTTELSPVDLMKNASEKAYCIYVTILILLATCLATPVLFGWWAVLLLLAYAPTFFFIRRFFRRHYAPS